MAPALVVSLHDVHPGSREAIDAQVRALAAAGVPRTSLLVVPRWHEEPTVNFMPFGGDRAFIQWLDRLRAAGHEIVLHGFYHQRVGPHGRTTAANFFWTRLYTNREAEFLDLPAEEARQRIADGLRAFRACGWSPEGFVAPAWLMPRSLPSLLQSLGFRYTNRLDGLISLTGARERFIDSCSLCWSCRAAWRRAASMIWNPLRLQTLAANPLLRISLHPADFAYPAVQNQILQLTRRALQAGRQPLTYAEFINQAPQSGAFGQTLNPAAGSSPPA